MRWGRGAPGADERRRTRGKPASANGASSFHLWWRLPPTDAVVEVAATVTVMRPPAVAALHFWALQVGFADRGRALGAAHTGLQWHPAAPAGAVNWGGYGPRGQELAGGGSQLAVVDSVNTRAWRWDPGSPYRLRVWSPAPGAWRSTVTDLADGRSAVIRDLVVGATELVEPVVWAEIFARCDDPPTDVLWSDLAVTDRAGVTAAPSGLVTSYQSYAEGGCANTESVVEQGAVHQRSGLAGPRRGAPGEVLGLE